MDTMLFSCSLQKNITLKMFAYLFQDVVLFMILGPLSKWC